MEENQIIQLAIQHFNQHTGLVMHKVNHPSMDSRNHAIAERIKKQYNV